VRLYQGKIGVEHAHPKDIRDALMHVSSSFEEAEESIDKSVHF
jgi:ribonuclease M5